MSFSVICYFNDPAIATTSIYDQNSGYVHIENFGHQMQTYSGSVGPIIFYAIPASGYRFTSWTYRVGSLSSPPQQSNANPFTYSGSQDIYIHADGALDTGGGGGGGSWDVVNSGGISGSSSNPLHLDAYRIYRYSVQVSQSGKYTFSSVGSLDTMGYLSSLPDVNLSTGAPSNQLIMNDDKVGRNFGFSYDLVSGTTYYLFVRCCNGESSGSTVIQISKDGQGSGQDDEGILSKSYHNAKGVIAGSATIVANGVIRISFIPANSGTLKFYSTVDKDTYGFLSETPDWDRANRRPVHTIVSNDDGGGGNYIMGFLIETQVTKGNTYYLWARFFGVAEAGLLSFRIEAPEIHIEKWSWSSSNGYANSINTLNSYNALHSGGLVSDFSYVVWNDMVDKVKEIQDAIGVMWNSTYASYPYTKMTEESKVLTAARYNSLLFNVTSNYHTMMPAIGTVEPGDIVRASSFLTIANYINGWIDAVESA